MARQQRSQPVGQALALIQEVQPARLPIPAEARQRGVSESEWKTFTDAIYPAAKTVDGVMLALRYCDARKLDPFKRVVHVVPMWSAALGREVDTVWPGIGELRTTAGRTGQWAGNDDVMFGPMVERKFEVSKRFQGRNGGEPYVKQASSPMMRFPEWAQLTVYKIVGGHRVPFVGPKVFFEETFSGQQGLRVPNDRWQQAPRGMLEKCAEAAALRRAFPEELGDEWTAEEAEGRNVDQAPKTINATYHFVSSDEAAGAGADDDGKVEVVEVVEVVDDNTPKRDLRGWKESELDEYLVWMEEGFGQIATIDKLERALGREETRLATLPAAERDKIDAMERAARDRIAAAEAEKAQEQGETGENPSETVENGEKQPENAETDASEAKADEEPAFVRNLRLRVSECEIIADLNTLAESEARSIDALPRPVANLCDQIIAERREALKSA